MDQDAERLWTSREVLELLEEVKMDLLDAARNDVDNDPAEFCDGVQALALNFQSQIEARKAP